MENKHNNSPVTAVIGGQNGDEGKAKTIDYLLYEAEQDGNPYGFLTRFQGGPNAGHTTYLNGIKHVSHQIPCAPFFEKMLLGIGPRVVFNPERFIQEYKELIDIHNVDIQKRMVISHTAPVATPYHILLDCADEFTREKISGKKIGSTKQGIAPVYMDIVGREKLSVSDLLDPKWESIVTEKFENQRMLLFNKYTRPYGYTYDHVRFSADCALWMDSVKQFREGFKDQVKSFPYYIHSLLRDGKRIMAEGAQGTMIDVDFGPQPNVTSSNPISGGVAVGLGIAPHLITDVVMVIKAAYNTKVGSGPFPSQFEDAIAEELRKCGNEFGATTGRKRDIGWIDWVALKYAILLNGPTRIFLTKLDVTDTIEKIGIVKRYKGYTEDLHELLSFDNQIGEVEYVDGWLSSTAGMRNQNQLPEKCIDYLYDMETLLQKIQPGLRISHIGTGVDRLDTIRI